MALCRIWYGANEKVYIQHVDYKRKPDDVSDTEFAAKHFANSYRKNPDKYNPMDFEDVDDSTLPACCFKNTPERLKGERNKLRGTKLIGLRIDNTIIIREDLIKQRDDELDKSVPDMVKVMRLQKKLDKKEHD